MASNINKEHNSTTFNIDTELTKLIIIIDDVTFNSNLELGKYEVVGKSRKIDFLWQVLKLTIKYPQVELYLKKLLNYCTIDELKDMCDQKSILHFMLNKPSEISIGAFKIIINYGININKKDAMYNTASHVLATCQWNSYSNVILNLLFKHGMNPNIINFYNNTILDTVVRYQKLDKETQNCIMTLIDFGAIINNAKPGNEIGFRLPFNSNSKQYDIIYDFIEYYTSLTIKPAIKNENKI